MAYEQGHLVSVNLVRAVKYYRTAAKQGMIKANLNNNEYLANVSECYICIRTRSRVKLKPPLLMLKTQKKVECSKYMLEET